MLKQSALTAEDRPAAEQRKAGPLSLFDRHSQPSGLSGSRSMHERNAQKIGRHLADRFT